MQVSAKVDYALRAMLELAASPGERLSRDAIATAQGIPPRYLEEILGTLRQSGLVSAVRGASGGFLLARPAGEISVADVSRAVEGPLTLVQGQRPESVSYPEPCVHLRELWVGLRASMRSVLESVSVEHLLTGELPAEVQAHLRDDDAWVPR